MPVAKHYWWAYYFLIIDFSFNALFKYFMYFILFLIYMDVSFAKYALLENMLLYKQRLLEYCS